MYRKLSERKLKLNTKTRLRTLPFETQIIKRYQTRQSSVEEALIEMCLTEVFLFVDWKISANAQHCRREISENELEF